MSDPSWAGELYPVLRQMVQRAVVYGVLTVTLTAQEPPPKAGTTPVTAPGKEDLSLAPAKVDVKPVARDEEIRQRRHTGLSEPAACGDGRSKKHDRDAL